MPQTFVALQCAFCNTFQGQLDKKSKKFTCVICNAKQSFRTIFAVSNSGKDIRVTVQQLNEFRGAHNELKGSEQAQQLQQQVLQQQQQSSKAAATAPTHTWQEFAAEGADGPEDDAAGDESGFVTAVPDVQLGKRQQRSAAAGSGGAQQTYNKRSKQQQQGGESSSAALPGRMQQHSAAPGRAAQYGQPHAGVAHYHGQLTPQWQQPSSGAQSSRQGTSSRQPLQKLPQQGQHANQAHAQQQQQGEGQAGISSGSWHGNQGNQTNTAQQPWYTPQQQQRQQQQQQGSYVPWPAQQHQQGNATAGAQAGAPPNQSIAFSGPGQYSSNQQPPGWQAQKQPGPQASWQQQQQQQQGQTWLPKQQQMQQEWRPKGQQQWQAQQQHAWQQPPCQGRPAQQQLTCHGRLPGAARQAGPNRPPPPLQAAAAAAAKAGRAPAPAAATAWSAFVDDADQAAGEGSDDDDVGMCFVTDADVAAQWT